LVGVTRLLDVLTALSDACRLRIMGLVDNREVCVSDIYAVLGIPQPTASKHLGVLRRAGLVDARRQGLWMYYRVASPSDPGLTAVLRATVGALRSSAQYLADRRKLDRRSASVVIPQAWHGTDPDFLD
jgi:ArsR family transcriptional regulator, arsenate/arsenite/antimonite-responsive transcriptional repressor